MTGEERFTFLSTIKLVSRLTPVSQDPRHMLQTLARLTIVPSSTSMAKMRRLLLLSIN